MGGFLSSPKPPPPPPPPPPPAVMPTPDDAQVKAAKKKSVARQSALSGRESTLLTSPLSGRDEKMGG